MRVRCPDCEATLKLASEELPRQIKCPRCGVNFRPRPFDETNEDEKPKRTRDEDERSTRTRDEDDDRPKRTDDAPKRKSKKSGKKGKTPWLALGIGAGVAAAVTGVIIWIISSNNKSSSTSGKETTSTWTDDPPVNPNINPVVPPNVPRPDPKEDELFSDPPGRPTPRLFVPVMTRASRDGFDLPRLATYKRLKSKMAMPPDMLPDVGKMTLEQIKKATTYIKVGAGFDSSTGSGFVVAVDGTTALIATNNHVIDRAIAGPRTSPFDIASVYAVFDSGLKTEQSVKADIIATDAATDLALLKVTGVRRMPSPIDPRFCPELRETTPIVIYGFPFGEDLASGSSNPTITVGKGSISSLVFDKGGELSELRIDGSLNPGNSGGPILDADGRLVGIAVKTIKGSGIGMAIPAQELIAMLDGRVHSPTILPAGRDGNNAVFHVAIPVIDPLKRVNSLQLSVLPNAKTKMNEGLEADGTWRELPATTRISVPLGDKAQDYVRVTLPARERGFTTFQLVSEHTTGEKIASRPVTFEMNLNRAQTDSEPLPLSALAKNPTLFADKLVVFKGNVYPDVTSAGHEHEVRVEDENGAKITGFRFRVSFAIMSDLRGFPKLSRSVPGQIVALVGKADATGNATVYIRRLDLLGRGERKLTIPFGLN